MDEYQVKAAFLYNFAKFVEWPSQAFQSPSQPFSICVLGANPFGGELDRAVKDKVVEGRPVNVLQVSNIAPRQCHIVFVSSDEEKKFLAALPRFQGLALLTVGDGEGFAKHGGVMNFKLERGRVHFQINQEAARQQHLHISSKLLGLAELVRN